MNNTLKVINSRLDEAKDQISDLEVKLEKTPKQRSKNKEKSIKK